MRSPITSAGNGLLHLIFKEHQQANLQRGSRLKTELKTLENIFSGAYEYFPKLFDGWF
jgi:hypothetical protein